jgi:hypothetical protein
MAYHGYPQAEGLKKVSVIDHVGPASYVQAGGGGDVLVGLPFGVNWIEHVDGGIDNTGTYFVVAIKNPGQQNSVKLMWFTIVGMTEVASTTNLSGSTVSLVLRGN